MDKLIGIDELANILAENAPDWHVEVLNYYDMLVAFKEGRANWDLWAGSMGFQRIVDEYGSVEQKKHLTAMGLGYRYKAPTSTCDGETIQ